MRNGVGVLAAVVAVTVAGCGAGTEESEPDRWRIDYVSDSRRMQVRELVAVAPDEGWAVGHETKDGDTVHTLLHRDGAHWQTAPVPPALRWEGGAVISELAASGPDDVWLFGTLAADEIGRSAASGALRWDGRVWHRVPGSFTVRDAVALAPDDVWALDASTSDPVAHHWNGAGWDALPLPAGYLDSLTATGPDDVWAAGATGGQPAFAHFDGQRWQAVQAPAFPHGADEEARVYDIVSVSRDEVWAFGAITPTRGNSGPPYTPFALRWNGTTWEKQPDAFDTSDQQTPPDSALLATSDGGGGFVVASVFGAEQHRTRTGEVRVVKDPPPVPGRTDQVTDVDRRQHLEVHDLQLVPGTREVWAAGAVGVSPLPPSEQYTRGVVVSYTAG
ncbi:MAG: hypothetical protein HOY78_01610 [Saccharothrix sp.]|nr:hypothetical protein [Saccharothrix sp.]